MNNIFYYINNSIKKLKIFALNKTHKVLFK